MATINPDDDPDDHSSLSSSGTLGRSAGTIFPPLFAHSRAGALQQGRTFSPSPKHTVSPFAPPPSKELQSREGAALPRLIHSLARLKSPSPDRQARQYSLLPKPPVQANGSAHSPSSSVSSESYLVYSSSESDRESNPDSYGGDPLEIDWRELVVKRDEVNLKRREILDQRKALKEKRRLKEAADNRFMSLFRPLLAEGQPRTVSFSTASLQSGFRELQATRTEYQVLEARYESLEDALSQAEFELESLERLFLGKLYSPLRPTDSTTLHDDMQEYEVPPSRMSLLGIPSARPEDVHPIYEDLMSAIGDLQLAQEHKEDLIMHKEAIQQGQENLKRIEKYQGRELAAQTRQISDADLEFLRDYEVDERDAQNRIDRLAARVERLKKQCYDEDLIPKTAPFHEIYSFQPDIRDDLSIDLDLEEDRDDDARLADQRFPLLLFNPSHILDEDLLTAQGALRKAVRLPAQDPARRLTIQAAKKECSIESLVVKFDDKNKSDFINRWLLHRLRTSRLEADLLYSVFSSCMKILNFDKWQADVLFYWPRDPANLPAETFIGPITSDGLDVRDLEMLNTDVTQRSRAGSETQAYESITSGGFRTELVSSTQSVQSW